MPISDLGISGLGIDLDAQAITPVADGTNIATWNDGSGNARHAANGAGSFVYKTNIIGSLPIIRVDGTAHRICNSTTGLNLAAYTIFVVMKLKSGSVCGKNNYGGAPTDLDRRKLQINALHHYSGADANVAPVLGAGVGPTRFVIVAVRVTNTTTYKQWINGVDMTYAGSTLNTTANTNTKGFSVGRPAQDTGAEQLTGDIAQVVVYENALSDGDMDTVHDWLKTHWSFSALRLPLQFGLREFVSNPNNIKLWLDIEESNDGIANGAGITNVFDISGQMGVWSGGTVPVKEDAALNSRAAAVFNGTTTVVPQTALGESQFDLGACTVFAVYKTTGGGTGPIIAKGDHTLAASNDNRRLMSFYRTGWGNGRDGAAATPASPPADNAYVVQSYQVNSAASVDCKVNDDAEQACTIAANFNITGNNNVQPVMGRAWNSLAVEYSAHKLCALIIINEVLNDAGRDTLQKRLGWLYGFGWGEAPPDPDKFGVMTTTINFTQSLAPQGWIIRSVTSAAVNRIPGGGRQIIRTAAGVMWHCYYSGGQLKTARSTDGGLVWTEIAVGPTWAPAGMAMCVGAGDEPVLVATRPSNDDFYIYQYNGTSWVLKKQLNEPIAESESFQILYTGSTYMLVFGFITSTSDRRVYSKTSTNLTTWATSVLMKNGDGSGTGPQKYRRVAAFVDVNGDIHAAYSIRSGGSHKLFYRKYSGGVWGTEQTIVTGGSGNNLSDYQSGLSMAVDDLGVVHLIARIKDTTYTSRVKLRYYQRSVVGVWSAEDVHATADGDQDFPSLSMNGRRPVICWASAGLGLGVNRALRATDGSSWSNSQITANVRDTVQTVHGPRFGSSYAYSRGVVGSMRGSEEYFQSSDALAGTAAFMENTINFGSILSTLQRVMSNSIDFVGTLVGVRSIGLTNTIIFSHRLNFTANKSMSNTIEFIHHLGGSTATEVITQTIHFTDTLAGIKTPIKSITQTINFVQGLFLTKSATLETSMVFSGIADANIVKQQSFSQNINFGSALTLNFSLNKLLSSMLTFVQGLIGYKADEGCEPNFTPEKPIPAEDSVSHVYLIGPVPELTLAVQLKRPEYGNTQRQGLQVKVNRTRGGNLRVHKRTPTYRTLTATFQDLTLLKLDQVGNFLRTTKGRKVYYIDELNRKWDGYITNSDIDLTVDAREKGGTFVMDFEGRLV